MNIKRFNFTKTQFIFLTLFVLFIITIDILLFKTDKERKVDNNEMIEIINYLNGDKLDFSVSGEFVEAEVDFSTEDKEKREE
jgi:hypothetical protein